MKNLKKILALAIAAMMVMAMGAVAFAENGEGGAATATVTPKADQTTETDGSVKVINANEALIRCICCSRRIWARTTPSPIRPMAST